MSNVTRKLPTRPGWWWGREFMGTRGKLGDLKPYRLVARGDDGSLMVEGPLHLDNCDFYVWLAPIHGPATCAALADFAGAVAACDATSPGKMADVYLAAVGALRDAIRAERDGAA